MATPVNQMVEDVKKELEVIVAQVQEEAKGAVERLKAVPPQDWGMAGGIALIVCAIGRFFTMDHDESLLSVTLLLHVLIFTVQAELVHGLYWFHQYSSSLVLFSVLSVINLFASSPLLLAAFPIILNNIRQRVVPLLKQAKA